MVVSARSTLLIGLYLLACTDTGADDMGGGAGATSAGKGGTASAGTGSGGKAGATSTGGSGGSAGKASSGGAGAGGSAGGGAGRAGAAGSSAGTAGSEAGTGGSSGTAGGSGGNAGSAGSTPSEGGASGESENGEAGAGGQAEPGGLTSFTLAVIGSSTAAGEGASSSSRGWVNLLASELEDRVAGDFTSRNLSVGGYATSNLMPGSSSNGNIDDAIDEEPNLIIVALAGSNDLSNGVSTETFLSRLTTIRDTAVDAGIPVFFVSTAPKDLSDDEQEALLDWTDQMREDFGSCWTPNTSSYSPCFIDIFESLANSSLGIAEEYGSGDGIHLNDAGHQRIFEIAETIVRPYVCSMTECG